MFVIAYPRWGNSRASHFYHLYCKYFPVNHKPRKDSVHNTWGEPIIDPEANDTDYIIDDDIKISRERYFQKFECFCQYFDILRLEIFNLLCG